MELTRRLQTVLALLVEGLAIAERQVAYRHGLYVLHHPVERKGI